MKITIENADTINAQMLPCVFACIQNLISGNLVVENELSKDILKAGTVVSQLKIKREQQDNSILIHFINAC